MAVQPTGYMPRVNQSPYGFYPYGAQHLAGMEGAYQIFDYSMAAAARNQVPGRDGFFGEPVVLKKSRPANKRVVADPSYRFPERKVLVLNFDPMFDTSHGQKRQHELLPDWNDPKQLATDFVTDILEASHGNVNYAIAEWIDVDELPRTEGGASYTKAYYQDTLKSAIDSTGGAYWTYEGWEDLGGETYNFGYKYYIDQYKIIEKVNNNEIDEVWIFAGPETGVIGYDCRMAGKKAFDMEAPAIAAGDRAFFIHFFNYENDVSEMLENAGHRAEYVLNKALGFDENKTNIDKMNDWEKFRLDDEKSPDQSGVGSLHRAPNSQGDYDWGNTRYILSYCADWANYPNLTGQRVSVNSADWGRGDARSHHKWWLGMLPHDPSLNNDSGKLNNWWLYFVDPVRALSGEPEKKPDAQKVVPAQKAALPSNKKNKLPLPRTGTVSLNNTIYF